MIASCKSRSRADGRTLAAGDNDGTLVLFDTATRRRRIAPYRAPSGIVRMAMSPDGRTLAISTPPAVPNTGPAAYSPTAIDLVDTSTWRRRAQVPAGRHFVQSLSFSPDGRTLLTGWTQAPKSPAGAAGPGRLARFDVRTGRPRGAALTVTRGGLSPGAAYTADGRHVVIGNASEAAYASGGGVDVTGGYVRGLDPGLTVLDARTLRRVRRVAVDAPAYALAPDGATAAVGGRDGSLTLVDLRGGRVRRATGRHEARIHALEFSRDSRRVATTGDDGRVIVWDARRAQAIETLEGHAGRVLSAAFAPDGATLFTSSFDGSVIVWDVNGARRLGRPFRAGASQIQNVFFDVSPDGRTMAVAQHDAVNLIDLEDPARQLGGSRFRAPAS